MTDFDLKSIKEKPIAREEIGMKISPWQGFYSKNDNTQEKLSMNLKLFPKMEGFGIDDKGTFSVFSNHATSKYQFKNIKVNIGPF